MNPGCLEAAHQDLRSIIRVALWRDGQAQLALMDGRTLQSICESDPRADCDGYKRKSANKANMAADTLRHMLAAHIAPANERERAQARALCETVQQPWAVQSQADLGYTGEKVQQVPKDNGTECAWPCCPDAKKGRILLTGCWRVKRSLS